MSRWRKLRELSWADRRVLLHAAVLLVRARLTVPRLDFRADSGAADGAHSPAPAAAALQRAQAIARLVGIAAAHVPVDAACLHRSLVLWRLLRGRGIPCELRLGAGTAGGAFEAHAWVECEGVALNEGADHLSRYRPFGRAVMPVGRRPRWGLATRRAS
jgi:hypothetical protein